MQRPGGRLRLRPLEVGDEAAARHGHRELALDGFEFLLDLRQDEEWPGYLARLERQRHGLDLPERWVPSTFLVGEADGQLVGRVSLRHELNDFLMVVGGHVGYGVRPDFRRRGYATQMLRQTLPIAHRRGIERVLVTCDDDNVASGATIERCGGVPAGVAARSDGRGAERRYWISTGLLP